MMKPLFVALGIALFLASAPASAQSVIRYANSASDAITSRATEIPVSAGLVMLSGQTPTPADATASPGTRAYWGDTETQSRAVFAKLATAFAELHLSLKDLASLRIYLVGDPALGGRPDLAGFERGYAAAFTVNGKADLPSRTVVTVAALGHPGVMIEVEAVAARRSMDIPKARAAIHNSGSHPS